MQTSTNTSLGGLLGSQRLNVDCEEYANDQTTCLDLATNGDPRGTSDGPGDPTGDPRFARLRGFVLRVAALHYWSLREAGMPLSEKPVSRPVQSPTRQ